MKNKKIFYLIITLIIAAEIFLFSTIKTGVGGKSGINLALIYHFGIFFLFTFFLVLTIKKDKINSKIIIIALLISLIYAISDEFHQLFVQGRFASVKDVLTDFAGSLIAVLFQKKIKFLSKL